MLTREETRWSLNAFETFSILNILPIQVESGKIQRQSNSLKLFIWKLLFGVGVSHWLYIFGRLVQSTVINREKYFRWDHFVLHLGTAGFYAVWYFTGFRLFVENKEENVMIFNQLFKEREDPVQKMVDRILQMRFESGNGNGKRDSAGGNQERGKSGAHSARHLEEKGENRETHQSESRSSSKTEVRPRPLLTWPLQYSLDELIAKLLPLVFVFTGFSLILILAIDPTRPQLLYSFLPPEWQNLWSFLIFMAVEALCYSVVAFTAGFAIVTQVLFFSKCQLEFKRLSLQLRSLQEKFQDHPFGNGNGGREIEREIWILRQILEEMRELVVFIELFNRCFPFCIFAWKINSLFCPIVFYFFVIRHLEEFPVFGFFMGYLAIATTLTYTIMYGHAFSIPGKMDDLKQEFLLTAQKTTRASNLNANRSKRWRAELEREMRRIHGVGIKVGSFHALERESTPIFVDFVLRNIVNLLVLFPR